MANTETIKYNQPHALSILSPQLSRAAALLRAAAVAMAEAAADALTMERKIKGANVWAIHFGRSGGHDRRAVMRVRGRASDRGEFASHAPASLSPDTSPHPETGPECRGAPGHRKESEKRHGGPTRLKTHAAQKD